MELERVEELVLVAIAFSMLLCLAPTAPLYKVLVTLVVTACLVALLILRSIDWRTKGTNPFDWVLLSGISLSLIHLASFSAFLQTCLSAILVVLFALFYGLMAIILTQHRWLFKREPHG